MIRELGRTACAAAALAALVSLNAPAEGGEEPRLEPMERKKAEAFLAGVVEARSAVRSIAAPFVDKQESFILEEETLARGYLRLKKPDCVRRDILTPSRSLIILRGNSGWFCQPAQKPRGFDLDRSKGKDVAGTIFGLLMAESFALGDLEKRFVVKTLAVGEDLMLEMKPRKKELAEDLPVIRITFARRGVWPKRVQWESRDGDVITDVFADPVVNGEIPDRAFAVPVDWDEKLPPDAPAAPPADAGADAPAPGPGD